MSKQISRLKKVELVKTTKTIASNGEQIESIESIGYYYATMQEIEDTISVSVYGANINNMLRISSVRYELETYLKPKLNNNEDNLSKYYIRYDDRLFKIASVKLKYVDIEMFEN